VNPVKDLTQGKIVNQFVRLALPVMGSSLIQMTYSMVDIFWLGNCGSKAVAAAGIAGFFIWFGSTLLMLPKTGAEIAISQAAGVKDNAKIAVIATNALKLAFLLSLIFSLLNILAAEQLIGFFALTDPEVNIHAVNYLLIASSVTTLGFMIPTFGGIYNGLGNTKTPFIINSVGLIINMVLDPLLIYGWGIFPRMGVEGAALATAIAQVVVFVIFILKYQLLKKQLHNIRVKLFSFDKLIVRSIVKFGLPGAFQGVLFCVYSTILGKVLARYGHVPLTVESIGFQIEALSWMTVGGFSTALCAFTGQNFGVNNPDRIIKGYKIALKLSIAAGTFSALLFFFAGEELFAIFVQEKETIAAGALFFKIISISQIFMCIEIITGGALNGMGKTFIPSLNSIVISGLRIPAALILCATTDLADNSVWWSISVSNVLKGTILLAVFISIWPKQKQKMLNKRVSQ